MSNKNTPAFPTPKFDLNEAGQLTSFSVDTDGMTLRDYFAAKALQGMMADHTRDMYTKDAAIAAYKLADAMLEQREA